MSNQFKPFANGMGSRCKIMMRAGTLCRLISLSPSEVSITAEQTRSLSKALRPKAKCEFLYGRS
jgi:hypothetical protein